MLVISTFRLGLGRGGLEGVWGYYGEVGNLGKYDGEPSSAPPPPIVGQGEKVESALPEYFDKEESLPMYEVVPASPGGSARAIEGTEIVLHASGASLPARSSSRS